MKKTLLTTVYILTAFNSNITIANEQEKAIQGCKYVYKQSPQFSAYADQCIRNEKPFSFWQCVNKRMETKETIMFAMSQCENKQ